MARLGRRSVEVRERTAGLRQRTPEWATDHTRAPYETEHRAIEFGGIDAILVATRSGRTEGLRMVRNMRAYCAGALPTGVQVRRTFDMIVHTGTIDLHGHADDRSEAIRREFVAMAPEEANAVIGVQITTDVVLYDIGGGGAMYVTFAGNPAILDET